MKWPLESAALDKVGDELGEALLIVRRHRVILAARVHRSKRLRHWQCYTEDGAVRDRARNRQRTLVTLDNHLANGKSQTHSTWLRRNESIENGFSILRADTRTRILDSDCDLVVGYPSCSHNQCPRPNF